MFKRPGTARVNGAPVKIIIINQPAISAGQLPPAIGVGPAVVHDHQPLFDMIRFRQGGKAGVGPRPAEKLVLVANDDIALLHVVCQLEMSGEALEIMITEGQGAVPGRSCCCQR